MKNLKNEKGFTLIELLAVIVILAVLMMIAIPSMTAVIENAKKSTYVTTAKSFINQVRYEAFQDIYPLPAAGEYIVVATDRIKLDKGNKKSTFGAAYDKTKSYVVVLNDGTAYGTGTEAEEKYVYFVAMVDANGNGFTLTEENTLAVGHIVKGSMKSKITAINSLGTLQKTALTVSSGYTLSRTSYTLATKYA